ncbi:4545_t:CDS:2 [Diversispora eburnea]|uniref:4545_t:CDS:1 n=1 Tax=Diversispora eburnea TaxID=1213867 RepID=A0A9N8W003_9GLOM|nr:4545_t:CDS:2 [Diversispora eburnea]
MGITSSKNSESKIPEYPHLTLSNFPKDDDGETITLSDGRKMGYKEYHYQHVLQNPIPFNQELEIENSENSKEFIILLIPGSPSSRLFYFTDDIKSFCKQKNIKKCSLISYSAGGPYGLAASYVLGKPPSPLNKKGKNKENRESKGGDIEFDSIIKKSAIISSVAPRDGPNLTSAMPIKFKLAWWLAKNAHGVLSAIAKYETNQFIRDPVKTGRESNWLPSDIETYENYPGVEEMFLTDGLEVYSRGQVETVCWEYSLWGKDWGFKLKDIVWYGEKDYTTTAAMGQYIAEQIEGCESHFAKERGHLLYFEIWDEVIEWLISN